MSASQQPAPPPPACENCVYAFTNGVRFVCRRYPPSPRSTSSELGVADTNRDWWCGEYRKMTGAMPMGDVP
jgi:hypothetical protein